MLSKSIRIEVKDLKKHYGTKRGLDGCNAEFKSGDLNLIVGENGSGKSTLLKCIMGLIRYDGMIIKESYLTGYAPEEFVMPYFMNSRDFLESIGRLKDVASHKLSLQIEDSLAYFDLSEHADKHIGSLSNGMRQKINLIQAFLNHPMMILLDEPLHGLDALSQEKTIELIKQNLKDTLIIISTHYPEQYRTRRKKIYRMEAGKIVHDPTL